MSSEPDYVTVAPAVSVGRFCVLVMRYDARNDEYAIRKSSLALSQVAAKTLAESWAAALRLEVR